VIPHLQEQDAGRPAKALQSHSKNTLDRLRSSGSQHLNELAEAAQTSALVMWESTMLAPPIHYLES
jgi:hypothetical protein